MADGSVLINVGLDTNKAEKDLTRLKQKISRLEGELDSDSAKKEGILKNLAEVNAELDAAKERVRYLKEEYQNATGDKKSLLKEELTEALEEQKLLNAEANKLDSAYDRVKGRIEANTQKLGEMKDQAGNMAQQIEAARPMQQLGKSMDGAKSKLIKFVKAAVGIATAAALFNKLKNYTIDAVKEFAKGDAETQQNINNLKGALTALKGSWGAAFAPIFNAVVPLLQKLIGWLTAAANAVAQFLAVLSGRTTFKKAIANNNALAKSVGGAGEAAEKAEAQLASFDDLEILQDNSNKGGGGGGGAADGLQYEEEEIAPWAEKLAEHLKLIRDLALAVGAALLTWKVAKFVADLMGVKLTLKQLLGMATTAAGTVLYLLGFVDAWSNGVTWDNLIEMIGGATLAFLGLAMVIGITNAAWLLLAAGIGMLVVGLKDWITTGELSTQTFWLLAAGIAAVGIALALLISPWALLVAAIAIGALAIYKNWDTIKAKWDGFIDGLKQKWEDFKLWWDEKVDKVREFGEGLVEKFLEGVGTLKQKWDSFWNDTVKPIFNPKSWFSMGEDAGKGLSNGMKSQALPKFSLRWQAGTGESSVLGKIVKSIINLPVISWFARGGVFDGASVIGVGEAGKEAVVPLERNTEWINLVVDGVIRRLQSSGVADQLADAFSSVPMPAMAGGTVVPPNSAGSADALAGINETLADLRALLAGTGATGGGTTEFRLFMDGKELHTRLQQLDRQAAIKGGW